LLGMTGLRELGALVLMLASFMTPAMACVVADSPMTSAERACCQAMKYQCGGKGMPASHGCCQKLPGSVYDNALNAKGTALHVAAIPIVWLPTVYVENPASTPGWLHHSDYSPPKVPPSTISVLRI